MCRQGAKGDMLVDRSMISALFRMVLRGIAYCHFEGLHSVVRLWGTGRSPPVMASVSSGQMRSM
jgi:hypothetical protein